jgi:hypothetical protein
MMLDYNDPKRDAVLGGARATGSLQTSDPANKLLTKGDSNRSNPSTTTDRRPSRIRSLTCNYG